MLNSTSESASTGQTARLPALTASDPSAVFALKSLFHPAVAVLCLVASLLVWREPFDRRQFLMAVMTFFATAELLAVKEVTSGHGAWRWFEPLLDISLRWLLILALLWGLLHVTGVGTGMYHRVLISWGCTTPPVLWLGELGASHALHRGSAQLMSRPVVIVGLTDAGRRLRQRLESDPVLRVEVAGYFDDRDAARLDLAPGERLLGPTSALPRYAVRERIKAVYITLPVTSQPQLRELCAALQDSTASVYIVPDLFTFDLIQGRVDVIGGIPVLAVRETPIYGARAIAKRLCDVLVAIGALLGATPLLLLVAVGVRLSSPGPIIFRQRRYGLDGGEIYIYKFRSMTVTEDGAQQYRQVTRNDTRVTPFGAFIRRTSLDELPQLFNVLQGTLSLVGPRPHAIAVNEQYRQLIPGYMVRHKVKPGITGWAQVNGHRGGDDLESMSRRVQYDLEYLRHWSLALDLWILVRTGALIWRDSTAY